MGTLVGTLQALTTTSALAISYILRGWIQWGSLMQCVPGIVTERPVTFPNSFSWKKISFLHEAS